VNDVEGRITAKGLAESNARWLPVGTVVMALAGQGTTRGKVALLKVPVTCNQSLAGIVPSGSVDAGFLFHQLEGMYREIRMINGDDVRGGLNLALIRDMRVVIPPLPEQKKIAAILSSVDEAIQATQAVIDQTRRVKEGLLQDLLTRGIGHTRFKQTEIGEIPEGWEVSCLSDLSHRITKGTTPTTYGHAYTDHGVHFLRVENITDDGRIDLSETKYVSEETHRTFERSMLAGGELLISIAGAIGRAAVVRADAVPANVNQALAVLRLRDELVDEHYVLHAVMSKTVRDQIERLRAGLAQFNLNLKQVGELKIAVPPRDEQVLLSQKLDVSARLLEIHEGHFVSLRTLKSGLLTDLLTGKVRVAP